MLGKQMIGMPNIGMQMTDDLNVNGKSEDELRTNAIELRTLLSVVFKIVHQALEKRLSQHHGEMSRLQFGVLSMVDHADEPQTISDLSKTLNLDPSTLVPAVDALERKGLIIRQRDPDDRRRIPLSLTEEGKALIHQIREMVKDAPLMVSVGKMEPESLHHLLMLLSELVCHLPEGEETLKSAQSRMFAYGAKEEYLVCTQQAE